VPIEASPLDPLDIAAAVEKAVRVLNAASQTRLGLERKLVRAGYAAATADAACSRVEAMGYVNDRTYAEALLSKRRQQGRGVKVISSELRHKGIDPALIDDLLGQLSAEDEVEGATALAVKLLSRHEGEPLVRRREHVIGGLIRRGYAPWVARRAMEKASAVNS
jgi:regulatory protein